MYLYLLNEAIIRRIMKSLSMHFFFVISIHVGVLVHCEHKKANSNTSKNAQAEPNVEGHYDKHEKICYGKLYDVEKGLNCVI
jgi:hypothetical protein